MAAAYLAKETKIGSNGDMVTMDGGGVSTVAKSSLEVSMAMGNLFRDSNYDERRRMSEQGDGNVFLGCVSDDMLASIGASFLVGFHLRNDNSFFFLLGFFFAFFV